MPRGATEAGFDRHASRYAAVWGDDPVARAMRQTVHRVLDRLLPPDADVLDVGCGIGLDLDHLAATGRRPTGVDASAGMVAEARRRNPGIEVRHASLERLGPLFPQRCFDAALLDFGVINCVDLGVAARVLGGVVRPGGVVAIVSMPPVAPAWMLSRVLAGRPVEALGRLRRQVEVQVEGEAVPTRYWSSAEIRSAFAGAFDRVEEQALGLALPPPGSRWSAGTIERLAAIDRVVGRWPGLRRMGDHLLVVMRRR